MLLYAAVVVTHFVTYTPRSVGCSAAPQKRSHLYSLPLYRLLARSRNAAFLTLLKVQ
jgi:hypothetical protein